MRRLIAFTGDGKGKTSAALGAAVRAAGNGLKVVIYQFLKPQDSFTGEKNFLKHTNITIMPLGRKGKKDFNYTDDDINSAKLALSTIKNDLKNYDLVILDEISYPLNWQWFNYKEVLELFIINSDISFILTGRDMPKDLLNICDTVSIVQNNKHIYQENNKGQKGFEF